MNEAAVLDVGVVRELGKGRVCGGAGLFEMGGSFAELAAMDGEAANACSRARCFALRCATMLGTIVSSVEVSGWGRCGSLPLTDP